MASTDPFVPTNPQRSTTLAPQSQQTPQTAQSDTITALNDPFGYGFEGRIAVDRQASARRKGIAAVLAQFAARGMQAPATVQYNYFLTHGFYTAEELKEVRISCAPSILQILVSAPVTGHCTTSSCLHHPHMREY